jgi:uncharacterized membrane protein
MAESQNEHVVIAIFTDQFTAEQAVDSLKRWGQASSEIKLGAIGTIAKEGDKVRTQVGRNTGKGASVGAILGVIAAVLSGGVTLLGGIVSGAALGGMIGAFMKQSLQLTEDEIQDLGRELEGGKVAVVVVCAPDEAEPIITQLASTGGQVRAYDVPQQLMEATSNALAAEGAPQKVVAPTSETPATEPLETTSQTDIETL